MAYPFDFDEEEEDPVRPCDHIGCPEAGLYPAPKSRDNLQNRYYFCLEHVRQYNKSWNYFAGFSEEQMYEQMRKDTAWDRPTWQAAIPLKMEQRLHEFVRKFAGEASAKTPPPKTALSKEAQALETLGLGPQADRKTIKSRYRELVKKYHPDTNPDNPKAAERFRIVTEAYIVLRSQWHSS